MPPSHYSSVITPSCPLDTSRTIVMRALSDGYPFVRVCPGENRSVFIARDSGYYYWPVLPRVSRECSACPRLFDSSS